jgi:hypothetical protein
MAEDRVNIVDALRGQQEQLKRLIAQKIWISDAPKATLLEIDVQLSELKRLLVQLQSDVQDQLKKGSYDPGLVETDPMKQRSPEDVSKAIDLAGQQVDKLSDSVGNRRRTARPEEPAPEGAEGVQRYSRRSLKTEELNSWPSSVTLQCRLRRRFDGGGLGQEQSR